VGVRMMIVVTDWEAGAGPLGIGPAGMLGEKNWNAVGALVRQFAVGGSGEAASDH
jgi:hypothetical protein